MNNVKIQVFGSGCQTCKKMYGLVKEAADEMNLGIEVEYITDIQQIIALGVMLSPVLAVNGKAVLSGLVPSKQKIKELIQQNITA